METFSRDNPSPQFQELLSYYRQLHEFGDAVIDKRMNTRPEETFDGRSIVPHVGLIRHLVQQHQVLSLLDYGSGKGQGYDKAVFKTEAGENVVGLTRIWGVDDIQLYDPGYEPYQQLPQRDFDMVVCSDVLEHIPEQDLDWVLGEILGYANKVVFLTAALYSSLKVLPNGMNVHVTVKPFGWWADKIESVRGKVKPIDYCLVGIEQSNRMLYLYG